MSRFLTDLSGGKNVETADKREAIQDIKSFTLDVCDKLNGRINFWLFGKLNCL